ncbi:hypothetical protein ARMSODRAFT_343728 [Armillaria solidipes]|uniref:Uncharacterized protein n=1 Tax=Armillaria solidipes TaxID=1076256 RepID=A0A2H3BAR4_9AGAR|nr:hypothetical protein ARMSODRAFT_343728 [Armillaria solidipes]
MLDPLHNQYLPSTSGGRILLTKRTQEFRDQDRLERSYNQNIEIPSLEAVEDDLRESERNFTS